jgi:phosphatidate cytidylyltransferase
MSKELKKRILSSLVLLTISLFFILKGSIYFILFASLLFLIMSYEWYMMATNRIQNILGLIFLFFSFVSICYFKINSNLNLEFILVLLICLSSDIGGYIFGKLFKGAKLTKLSPNKTYSGMFGSYILSFISVSILLIFYSKELDFKFIILTIFVSSISQVGDIIISYYKRLSKVKDTGKILPGHGGLLDRFDGMIFAFPLSYFIFLLEKSIK